MKLSALLAGIVVAALAVPAMAQTSYYIVQDTKTKHCQIVDKAPTPTEREWTSVGPNGVVYHSRSEAETAMKTVKVCTSD
jgi:hypothetical protein